jgi:hypothetical protein
MPRALLSLLLLPMLAAPALAQPLDGTAKAPAAPSQCPDNDNMDAFADSDGVLTCACPAEQMSQGAVCR